MKKILAFAILLGLTAGAAAQTFPLNNVPIGKGPGKQGYTPVAPGAENSCLMVIGGVPTFSLCPGAGTGGTVTSVAAGDGLTATPGPITTSGTIRVTAGAANTAKGSLNGTTTVDLALPSCSTSTSVLQWTSATGFSCATNGDVAGSGTPVVGDLAAYTSTTGKAIAGTGYNASQVPGLIPTTSNVTISNASPGIVSWTAHGLTAQAPVWFCTTGGLPTGLTACVKPNAGAFSANTYKQNPTLYYVCTGATLLTDSFAVATSLTNAKAGTCVNTSSAGSGTHTAFANAMAPAGTIGELIYKVVEATDLFALTTGGSGVAYNSISVSAGIWLVGGSSFIWGNGGATQWTHAHSGIVYGFTTIPSAPFNGTTALHAQSNNSNGWGFSHDPQQIFLTGTTTVNNVIQTDFTGGLGYAYGEMWARRIK